MCEAVVCSVDKERTHVVFFSAYLEFTVLDIHLVLTLAGVAGENELVLVYIERVADLLFFAEEKVLSKCKPWGNEQ